MKLTESKGPIAMGMTVEFTDRVMNFGTDPNWITVLFATQAAGYHLAPEADDFAVQVANLARAWKSKKPAKVVVSGVDIVSVEPVP
jgi:hypothetical protein